ncbi:transcription termination/antitermination factor NusG [bacterium]|nr:transcription termination/antitermination factor NusG [candidate division CSSED10-310 bacterium]
MAQRWYVIHTYSGYEEKVKQHIDQQIKIKHLEDVISEVLVPKENVVEFKKGKKEITKKNFFPGYVLIKMEMDEELWHLIKNTPKVTNFVSSGAKPAPLSEHDVEVIFKQIEAGTSKPKPKIKFQKGERVRITDGPFANFTGVVDEVNQDRNTLRVMVSIFGRSTPVEVDFSQVEGA